MHIYIFTSTNQRGCLENPERRNTRNARNTLHSVRSLHSLYVMHAMILYYRGRHKRLCKIATIYAQCVSQPSLHPSPSLA